MTETAIALLFASTSYNLGLPPGLLAAVCQVESNYDVLALHPDDNGSNSVGICQLKHSTARLMGYKGNEMGLLNPATNVYYAGLYLRHNLRRYGHNPVLAISAYNAGRAKLHVNRRYVSKVMRAWEAR